ncbi:MAG: ABC transporter permease [Polyangiaceae bacterium]|nr:ABC transporter permease [Polyangiaceae bacterium]
MRGRWEPILALLLAASAWAAASRLGGEFPGPAEVAAVLARRARDGLLWSAVAVSLRRLVVGYALSVGVGFSLGVALAASDSVRRGLGPVVTGLQALPSVCWLPLGLLWFGLSDAAILFVIVLGSALGVAISVDAACRNVPPLYVRAARTMGARGLVLYRRVVLPAAFPEILTGLRLAWAFAWRSLMGAELLFVAGGLGHLLETGRELGDLAQVVAVMVVIVALGIASERLLFDWAEARLRARWGRATRA